MVKKYAYTWAVRKKSLVMIDVENFCTTKHLEKIKICLLQFQVS